MTTILEKTTGLVAFVRTAEEGSFSAGSRVLGSSQSAVSKSVARLESRLGVRLFQRSTRTLSLTAEGQAYYERVAPLLRAIDEADDIAVGAASVQGLLRVSAPQEFGRMLIACWAAEFLAHYPDVKIELQVTDRFVDIIREGYDVAVRMGALNDSELISRKITDLNWVMVASPSYIRKHGLPRTVEELASHTGLRYAVGGKPWPVAFADGTTLLLESRFDTDDSGSIRRAALAGAGIAYLLRVTVAEDLAAGDLVQILPQHALTRIPAYALHGFGKQLPARTRLFIEFLLKKAAEADI
ncbi:LysR family transcriptional regulator [Cupriavidus sp. D39]|uniref:LysR family transcriptional regulator n=1 Tax=Cupriavidus sp. D39 TaxID=2997877 RepID=UPI00226DD447|nr:LysR family transcriptional regulator [Cupriavidus sp. D39]MCY0854959.1 LysR family transcriptional regulator [Cupriavidus sp. D39]